MNGISQVLLYSAGAASAAILGGVVAVVWAPSARIGGVVLPSIASAWAGYTFLSGFSGGVMEGVLAFAAAALLWLVAEELLVEAHEVPETPVATSLFFVGFLLLLLMDMLMME